MNYKLKTQELKEQAKELGFVLVPDVIDCKELCKLLKITIRTLRTWKGEGELKNLIIKMPRTNKRKLIRLLRGGGRKGTWFYPRIFAAALYILLKPTLKRKPIIWIDDEYTGKQTIIKGLIIRFAKRDNNIDIGWEQIKFKLVGRKSKAHWLAIDALRGKIEADQKITAEEILKILEK